MQTIERQSSVEFFKWQTVGTELDVTVTELPVYDRPNQFGGKDHFFRGETAEGQVVQVPMPFDLKAKVSQVHESIVPGQTRFVIKFTGTRPIKGKAPMKLFSVGVEGLKEH